MSRMMNTTYRAYQLLERSVFNKKKLLADELDMSRPTLNSRLNGNTEWGKLEKNWINYLYKQLR